MRQQLNNSLLSSAHPLVWTLCGNPLFLLGDLFLLSSVMIDDEWNSQPNTRGSLLLTTQITICETQDTNSEVDWLEACQDNNIPKLKSRQRDFLFYVIKVQNEASYCRNKLMKTDVVFFFFLKLFGAKSGRYSRGEWERSQVVDSDKCRAEPCCGGKWQTQGPGCKMKWEQCTSM